MLLLTIEILVILYIVYRLAYYIVAKTTRIPRTLIKSKSVLITGCDTGFGQMTAIRLDHLGFRVFAACLLPKSLDYFKNLPSISNRFTPFVMDVTNQASVEAGFSFVQSSLTKSHQEDSSSEPLLYAIINNAGILKFSMFEMSKISDADLMIQVNYIGLLRVSHVFLPLLKCSQGLNTPHPLLPNRQNLSSRLINIASVAGRTSVPSLSGYCASKFAVQGLSDALRRELHFWGIKTVIIEPGVMKTPLYQELTNDNFVKSYIEQLPVGVREMYGEEYVKELWSSVGKAIERGGNPELVVDALEEAVMAMYPWHRYNVGWDSPIWLMWSYLPSWVFDYIWSRPPKVLPKITASVLAGKKTSKQQ